jgi:hypothetical protein
MKPDRSRPAADLVTGDVVILNRVPMRVLAEPRTVHRGWSLFDEFELSLEIEVSPDVPGGEPSLVVVKPNQELLMVEQKQQP